MRELKIENYTAFYNSLVSFIKKNDLFNKYFNSKLNEINYDKLRGATKIYNSFNEIEKSLSRMEDISTYISWTPRTKDMSYRFDFLLYHLTNHYHEIYILKERLITFLNIIRKSYRNNDFYDKLSNCLTDAYNITNSELKEFTNERSEHVHSKSLSREEISKFQQVTFLLNGITDYPKEAAFAMYNQEYHDLKKDWTKKIETRTSEAYKTTDRVISKINPIVLDASGNLIHPLIKSET